MERILYVYFKEKLAGTLIQDESGRLSFKYEESYLSDKSAQAISVSLSLRVEPYLDKIVRPFFSGLLPDEILRERLAKCLGVSEENPFALLKAVGGECAGALSLYEEKQNNFDQIKTKVKTLNDRELINILTVLKRRPMLTGEKGIRLSLAGAQDKIAVCLQNNQIALAQAGNPSTHILKPMIEGVKDSVQNETFCLKLAKLSKINTPNVEIRQVEDISYFLIERYDREIIESKVKRLHQEDFCQILKTPPELKYEREGGPNIKQCLEILDQHSTKPAVDRITFTRLIIFNYLIANADAHGKNFSLLYKDQYPELAPAYDLLSTAVYPNLSTKMAMKIGSKYDPSRVRLEHWHCLAKDTAIARKELEKELKRMVEQTFKQALIVKEQLNDEGNPSEIYSDILNIIKERSEYLNSQLKH